MKFFTITCMLLLLSAATLFAQKPNLIPPSPGAANLSKFGDIPVNLSTGTVSIQIPVYTAREGDLEWPISIDYHYSGYRPAEESGWIGRGWSLPMGVITRTVHGGRDEGGSGYDGYLTTGPTVKTAVENRENSLAVDYNFVTQIANGVKDGEPDVFNFSFGGISGKFFFGTDGKIYNTTGKAMDIQYEMSVPLDPGSGHSFIGNTFTKWTIRTEDGTKYIFRNAEYGWSLLSGEPFDKFKKAISAWHLSEIIGTNGESIRFTYTAPTDAFKRIQASFSQRKVLQLPDLGSPPNFFLNEGNNKTVKNYSEEIFLTKIQGSNWELQFNSTQSNKQVDGETSYYQKLNQIILRDISNPGNPIQIKTFDFTYDPADEENLFKFQEKSGASEVKPYTFEYYSSANPGLTRSIDNWGYYNGVDNDVNLIAEFGADRQSYLTGTLMGALSGIHYPTQGYTSLEYELNTSSYVQSLQYTTTKVTYDHWGFVWRKTANGLDLIQSLPFTLPETRSYEATYSFDYVPQSPPCKPLTQAGFLADGPYTAANFTPHPCIVADMPINGEIDVHVKVKKIVTLIKGDVGGLRVKKVSNYTGIGALATVKEYFYDNFSDSTRSSGSLADSINTSSVIKKVYQDNSACSAQIWKSEPLNSMSLTPLVYFNVEERTQDNRQLHEFTSFFGYTDYYGIMMAGGGSRMFGPISSYEFVRGLPSVSTHYRTDLTNKAYEFSRFYSDIGEVVVNSSPAIYSEHIASYNSPGGTIYGNADSKEYYVKGYKAIAGWVRNKAEITRDFGANASSTPVTVTTNYEYANAGHRQVTKQRTTQSNGTIEETTFKYPLDYKNTAGKAAFIQPMIDSNMVAYPLERTNILEKAPNDRRVIGAAVTTYKSFPGNPRKTFLILPYKKFGFKGLNGSIGSNFQNYDGTTNETASTSYRENIKYTLYDAQGNPLSLLVKGVEKLSYLWSYNGEKPVAEIQNADHVAVGAALGGTSFAQMAAMTDPLAIKNKLDGVRNGLPGTMFSAYIHSPLVGVTRVIDPAAKNLIYEYDPLSRLKAIKDNSGNVRSSYCYNYAGQAISCDLISATGAVFPPQLSLIGQAALPVTLVNFNAIREGRSALLSWNTTEETNSERFDIEHSTNGKQWTRIGSVDAKGESASLQYYSFRDGSPVPGDNLYRLKMVDSDGSYAYSRMENLHFDMETLLFPNPLPAGENLNLESAQLDKISHLKIYDVQGKMMQKVDKPDRQINIGPLPPGAYIIQITGTNGAVSTHRIVKQ